MKDGYTVGIMFFFLFFVLLMVLILALFVFWVWMLVDCLKRPDEDFPNPNPNAKLTWALIIIFTSYLGAILYFFLVQRAKKTATKKK